MTGVFFNSHHYPYSFFAFIVKMSASFSNTIFYWHCSVKELTFPVRKRLNRTNKITNIIYSKTTT